MYIDSELPQEYLTAKQKYVKDMLCCCVLVLPSTLLVIMVCNLVVVCVISDQVETNEIQHILVKKRWTMLTTRICLCRCSFWTVVIFWSAWYLRTFHGTCVSQAAWLQSHSAFSFGALSRYRRIQNSCQNFVLICFMVQSFQGLPIGTARFQF